MTHPIGHRQRERQSGTPDSGFDVFLTKYALLTSETDHLAFPKHPQSLCLIRAHLLLKYNKLRNVIHNITIETSQRSTGFPCYTEVELSYETFYRPKWQKAKK